MDLAFESVESRGKFQKILAFVVILVFPLFITTMSSFPYLCKRPDFQCKNKGDLLDNFHICPEKDICQDNFFDYKIIESTSLKNWAYQYELYCSKSYFLPLLRSAFYFASMIGNPLFLPLADKYGRKTMFNIVLIVLLAVMLNIYFAINEWHILLANVILGLINFSLSLSSIIITEYFDREIKSAIITMYSVANAISTIFSTIFFMYGNVWQLLFLINSAIALLFVILSQKYMVESPR